MINKIIIGVVIVMLGTLSSIFYTQNKKIEKLSSQLTSQAVTISDLNEVKNMLTQQVEYLNDEMTNYIKDVEQVNSRFDEFRQEVKVIEKKFSNQKFGNIANSKPITLKNIINEGTDSLFNELELGSDWSAKNEVKND